MKVSPLLKQRRARDRSTTDLHNRKHTSSLDEDGKFRLHLDETKPVRGCVHLKVPQFSQVLHKALSGKPGYIVDSAYMGRFGYKFSLYINTPGFGEMSLGFVLMKGQFDDQIRWPFPCTLSFKLVNQSGGANITHMIIPNPRWACFRKPTTAMNCPFTLGRFAVIDRIFKDGFIKEDTALFKIEVTIPKEKRA